MSSDLTVNMSDTELVAIIIGDDSELHDLATRILAECSNSLSRLLTSDAVALRSIDGVGVKKAQRLAAAVELGRRCAIDAAKNQMKIMTSQDVVNIFKPRVMTLQHEECWIVYLNGASNIIEQQKISHGGLDATVVDHRLIVKRALELLATRIVVVHNHPSGIFQPSVDDVAITKRIQNAAALFDISLLDHVILSREGDFSFYGAGLL